MADYATAAQIKGFAREPDALDDTSWNLLATAASRLFDNLCEVAENTFQAAGSATAQDFYGDGTAYLKLPPFTELAATTPVVVEDDEYDLPEYEVIDNQLVILDETKPLNQFERVARYNGWREGIKVTVSAKWGFTAIPSDVTLATIQIALLYWRQSDPSFAGISNAEGALVDEQLPPMAKLIVDKYREKYSQRALFG